MTATVSPSSLSQEQVQKLLAGPAGPPPPGIRPDFGNSNPIQTRVIINITLTETVCIAALIVRLFTQKHISRGLKVEDGLIVCASVAHIAVDIIGALCMQVGAGKHMWDITLKNFLDMRQRIFVYAVVFTFCICLLKTAILLQFRRILSPSRINRCAWVTCWTCIVFNLIFYAINILLLIFQCAPVKKQWDPFTSGHCLDLPAIYQSCGIFSIISDFVILIIPIPVVVRLNVSNRKKLAAVTIFATGILACVASVMRLYSTWRISLSNDPSFHQWSAGFWCAIELSAGAIIFCSPSFPQFYNYIISRGRNSASIESCTTERSPGPAERGTPKGAGHPYDMPSLASFEELETKKTMSTSYDSSQVLKWSV